MADDPRDPGILSRMRKRFAVLRPAPPPPPPQKPQWTPPPDHGKAEPGHIPTAFYTGLEPRKPRRPSRSISAEPGRPARATRERSGQSRSVRSTFEDRSLSARMKREQEFERRFKGEVARAEAREAMEDAEILRADARKQHIERIREWKAEVRYICGGSKPWSVEAGAHVNRLGDALEERFDREMAEIDAEEKRALGWAESLDLAEDKRRQKLLGVRPERQGQKLLGYTPDRPRDFNVPARPPTPINVPPGPGQVTPMPAQPFNEAAKNPEPARPELADAFNDAVTAPDPLAAYFAQFSRAAPPPDPNRQPLAPTR